MEFNLSLKLPKLSAEVDTGYSYLSRVVTVEQDVIMLNCEVEKVLDGMSIDAVGEVKGFLMGVYFIHQDRDEPTVRMSQKAKNMDLLVYLS